MPEYKVEPTPTYLMTFTKSDVEGLVAYYMKERGIGAIKSILFTVCKGDRFGEDQVNITVTYEPVIELLKK